ncbi:MAG: hypothetical protein R6V44_17705 [Paracoccaceae bacterium]
MREDMRDADGALQIVQRMPPAPDLRLRRQIARRRAGPPTAVGAPKVADELDPHREGVEMVRAGQQNVLLERRQRLAVREHRDLRAETIAGGRVAPPVRSGLVQHDADDVRQLPDALALPRPGVGASVRPVEREVVARAEQVIGGHGIRLAMPP